ncbi:MAG: hypothetical protein ABIU58_13875, partial [Ramlibacter sp.]
MAAFTVHHIPVCPFILKESMVLLQFLEDIYPQRPVAQQDPWRRAVENMMCRLEGDFTTQGYTFLMNQD